VHSGHLTVVGAGPKAVAIAAKRKVMENLDLPVPELRVIDQRGTGANWTGKHGYTNGSLPLGTPPEKDVGFPYSTAGYTPEHATAINKGMLEFSWSAFHVLADGHSYAEWVDRGKPNPRHDHWAEYLQWVADRAEMKPVNADLSELDLADERWEVSLTSGESFQTDAVVITSPGPPRRVIERPESSDRVLDGRDFWLTSTRLRIEDLVTERQQVNACVIGSGETAAAIVVELGRLLKEEGSVAVISKEGIIYTRGESYEENRLYSSTEQWRRFPADVRENFVKRTDRGVFSVTNKAELNRSEAVTTLPGTVRRIREDADSLVLEFADVERADSYDLVVDATGFEAEWFREQMSEQARQALDKIVNAKRDDLKIPDIPFNAALSQTIGVDLAVEGLKPHLHLPMHAAMKQGPGFPNLSCLGLLADRVLQRHCPFTEIEHPQQQDPDQLEPDIV
jgi:mycobactin lysine-N-oxygenase